MRSDKHQRIRFLFKLRHVQVEAWMINNIIFTCQSKNHLLLDPRVGPPRKYKVSMIVKVEDQAPFVEGLDSRMSFSQPGENYANAGDQARVDQAHLQALGQAYLQAKFLSKMEFNQDCFGHLFEYYYCLWTFFTVQTQR